MSMSLRTRFALAFALSVMAVSGALSFAIGERSMEEMRAGIGNSLRRVAEQLSIRLDQDMWARSGEVALLTTIVESETQSGGPATIKRALDRLKQAIPVFAWIGLTDKDGYVRVATGGILEGASIAQRPVFREGVKGPFIGDVHDAALLSKLLPNPSGEPMRFVDISFPVHDGQGRITGVLATHLDWGWAEEMRQSILKSRRTGRDVEIFVLSEDNTVLLGPAGSLGSVLTIPAVPRARQDGDGWSIEDWPDGRPYLTGYAFGEGFKDYRGLGWTVLAREPLDQAFVSVAALRRDIIIWGGIIALVCAGLGWFLAGRVAAPLHRIVETADRLRQGEAVEIPAHKGVRDIEMLTESLQALIGSLTQSETARSHAELQASHDSLTGLSNRLGLAVRLEQLLAGAERNRLALAALCLDLDGFKEVNDRFGHAGGDMLLKEAADRLRRCARGEDIVARLGGDEFIIVLASPPARIETDAQLVGERAIAALRDPIPLNGTDAAIGCSVGVALWPRHGTDFDGVIQLADRALYDSKRKGKNRVTLYERAEEAF